MASWAISDCTRSLRKSIALFTLKANYCCGQENKWHLLISPKIFVVQDATQTIHWNNGQASVHSFITLLQRIRFCKSLEHCSRVRMPLAWYGCCVSFSKGPDCLFAQQLQSFHKENTLFFWWSCKNRKNFINLCHNQVDLGIQAEWHLSEISHGTSACDG